jgi:hypothetical protein
MQLNGEGEIMRLFGGYLSLAVILSSCAPAAAQSAPFSIRLSAEKPEVKAGARIWVQIQMTNLSNHDVDCTRAPSNGSDRAYRYEVRDAGNPVGALVRKHPEIGETSNIWPCILKSGETTTKDDNLVSGLYDMGKPGKYVIRVSRFISGGRKEDGVIKSNEITITVTP